MADELAEPVETDGPDYIMQALFSAGPVCATGMGSGPLTWQELHAWNEATQSGLSAWELETVRQLSQSYAAEAHRAREPNAAPPHIEQAERIEADALKKIFTQVKKPQ